MQTLIDELPNYIYGTTRLGDESIKFSERVSMATFALSKTEWIHTSHTYGEALKVIKRAIEGGAPQPKTIVKLGWDSVAQIRETVHKNLAELGAKKIEVGQLCLGGEAAEQFQTGDCNRELRKLIDEGLVGSFVLEVWPWTSAVPLQAMKTGRPFEIIDGFIFYFNPLQRFVSDELWQTIQRDAVHFVAMRTTCGGSLNRLMESENAPEYLRKRAFEIKPIFEKSASESWTEFCARFALGHKGVVATVGATANKENLDLLVQETSHPKGLESSVSEEIDKLHEKWFLEHDKWADPWSM